VNSLLLKGASPRTSSTLTVALILYICLSQACRISLRTAHCSLSHAQPHGVQSRIRAPSTRIQGVDSSINSTARGNVAIRQSNFQIGLSRLGISGRSDRQISVFPGGDGRVGSRGTGAAFAGSELPKSGMTRSLEVYARSMWLDLAASRGQEVVKRKTPRSWYRD